MAQAEMITQLLQSGLALVPIPQGEKKPKRVGWNLRTRCVTSVDGVGLLEGKNVGLAHAYCSPSPTCALDIDNFKAAKLWFSKNGIDLTSLLQANDAVVIWSGKKYSLKLLYRLPFNQGPLTSIQIKDAEGRVAWEFRCATKDGKTVQDVLPPSIHPSGTSYEWLGQGSPLSLPKLPSTLMELWKKLLTSGSKTALRPPVFMTNKSYRMETPQQIAIVKDALGYVSANCSYEIWRNVVWAILSTGWTCAEAIAEEWSQTAPARFAEDSSAFGLLIRSFDPSRENAITLGTLFHHARLGGWHGY